MRGGKGRERPPLAQISGSAPEIYSASITTVMYKSDTCFYTLLPRHTPGPTPRCFELAPYLDEDEGFVYETDYTDNAKVSI